MTAYTFSKFANPTSDVVPQPVVDLALEFTPTATISANEGVFVWDNFKANGVRAFWYDNDVVLVHVTKVVFGKPFTFTTKWNLDFEDEWPTGTHLIWAAREGLARANSLVYLVNYLEANGLGVAGKIDPEGTVITLDGGRKVMLRVDYDNETENVVLSWGADGALDDILSAFQTLDEIEYEMPGGKRIAFSASLFV
jgi:hypothetical protein